MRIKCPHCNGKGFSELNSAVNMTCGWCMGQGELDLEIVPTEPQTNEEWLNSMTTEEKAEWIYCAMFYKSCQKDVEDGARIQMMTKKDYIKKWLKEKHTE